MEYDDFHLSRNDRLVPLLAEPSEPAKLSTTGRFLRASSRMTLENSKHYEWKRIQGSSVVKKFTKFKEGDEFIWGKVSERSARYVVYYLIAAVRQLTN